MRALVQLTVGANGETVLPEQTLDTIDVFWVPRSAAAVELSVGVHANEVVATYAADSSVETRLFGGVLHTAWRPVTPNLPLGAMVHQAVFVRAPPDTALWLEGETPDPNGFVTRNIVNVRVGKHPLLHQCRPMQTASTVRAIPSRPDCTLVVASGFSFVRQVSDL